MKVVETDKLQSVLDFEAGCYSLMLIARKKNNEDLTHSNEIVIRRVVYKPNILQMLIDELVAIADYDSKHEYKLYISLNPRSKMKAYKNLKEQMAKWDFELIHNPEVQKKILKIDAEWISCLAKNPAKKKWFMLDLDDKNKLGQLKNLVEDYHDIPIISAFETKNGYHILFKPCDTRKLMEDIKSIEIDCELKRDDLLCIGYMEEKDE